MGVIGILTCEILEKEFSYLFANDRDISRISVIEDAKSDELIRLLLAQGDNRLERLVHLQSFSPESDSKPEILIRVLELALHNRKHILQEGLIQAAREMGPYVDVLLLGYGVMRKFLSSEYHLYACGKNFRMP